MTHASCDFPSDARGYSWGGTAELYLGRLGAAHRPDQRRRRTRTAADRFPDLASTTATQLELEHDHVLFGQARRGAPARLSQPRGHGALRRRHRRAQGRSEQERRRLHRLQLRLGERHRARPLLGAQAEREARHRDQPRAVPSPTTSGVFFRGMYSDGQSEVDAYNPADRSVSFGSRRQGLDVAPARSTSPGVGFGMSWISDIHARLPRDGRRRRLHRRRRTCARPPRASSRSSTA